MIYRFGPSPKIAERAPELLRETDTRAGQLHAGIQGNQLGTVAMKRRMFIPASVVIFGACSSQNAGTPPPDGSRDQFPGTSAEQNSDWAKIVTLEDQAKAIVHTDGCAAEGDCKTAPVGSRGCGGPRYYLVYCTHTTDVAALTRKLDEIAAAEKAFNARYKVASTCEFRMPPAVGLIAGGCSAK